MSKSSTVISVCAGLIAGIGATVVLDMAKSPQRTVTLATTSARSNEGTVRVGRSMDRRLLALERRADDGDERLIGLEQTPPQAGDTGAGASVAPPPPSLEQARAQLERQHAGWLEAHDAQPVDPEWAGSTEVSLMAAIDDLGFETDGVDCRTDACVASISWPSYPKAVASYDALVHHGYDVPCARRILLPEPADDTTTYRADLIFDCSEKRR